MAHGNTETLIPDLIFVSRVFLPVCSSSFLSWNARFQAWATLGDAMRTRPLAFIVFCGDARNARRPAHAPLAHTRLLHIQQYATRRDARPRPCSCLLGVGLRRAATRGLRTCEKSATRSSAMRPRARSISFSILFKRRRILSLVFHELGLSTCPVFQRGLLHVQQHFPASQASVCSFLV